MCCPPEENEGEEAKGRKVKIRVESEEAKELKEVFNAITEFVRNIKGPVKDLMEVILNTLKGDVLGEEVGKFYVKLKESGVPEDLAKELTRKFLNERLIVSKLIKDILSRGGRGEFRAEEIEKIVKEAKEAQKERQ
ncbi:MAG TPA: hypothetical protein ENF75_06895 [Acidilobales archaeon]|nr:hypothetical protein [Acidilobales archaeon]